MAYDTGELMAYYRSQIFTVPSGNVRNKAKGKARIPLAMMGRNVQSVLDYEEDRSRRLKESCEVEPGILRRRA